MAAKPNPKHLALWAIAGTTLAAGIFFIPWITAPHRDLPGAGFWANRWRTLTFLIPFVSGIPFRGTSVDA